MFGRLYSDIEKDLKEVGEGGWTCTVVYIFKSTHPRNANGKKHKYIGKIFFPMSKAKSLLDLNKQDLKNAKF